MLISTLILAICVGLEANPWIIAVCILNFGVSISTEINGLLRRIINVE